MRQVVEAVSVWSCWAVTGLAVSWCALAHALGWRWYALAVDAALRCIEDDHCRASARRCGLE